MYLGLEVVVSHAWHSISKERYSGTDLRLFFDAYGAITLFGVPFQGTSAQKTKVDGGRPTRPHFQSSFNERIRFALDGFHSLLLTASLLISFPPGTETFHFPGLLILADYT